MSLMSPLRRMCLSSSMSSSVCYQVANVAPAFALGGMFAVRSYGRKANAAPAPPKAASAAPEKKVPRQKREPSAYAKFVKAKFTSVRVRIVVFFLPFVFFCILVRMASLFRGSWCFFVDDFCSHVVCVVLSSACVLP